MGGRGAKSNLPGIPKNKWKKLTSLKRNVDEHTQKIRTARATGKNTNSIHHWQSEINAWNEQINKIEGKYKK